jgi:outer membrane protein assembly factor BamD
MRSFVVIVVAVLIGLSSCSEFSKVQKSTDYDYKLRMADTT